MLIHDHFQNYKVYQIPKAQLIIADVPYNIGNNAYASNPAWYKDGDNLKGESELAGKEFFDTDKDFRPAEFMHFCSTMLKKEDLRDRVELAGTKLKSNAPCMVLFCEWKLLNSSRQPNKGLKILNNTGLIKRKWKKQHQRFLEKYDPNRGL